MLQLNVPLKTIISDNRNDKAFSKKTFSLHKKKKL